VKIESIKKENESSFGWKHLAILIGFTVLGVLFLAVFQASSSSTDLEGYEDPFIGESDALNESGVGGNDTENDSSETLINSTEEPVMEENNSSSDAELYINTSSSDVIQ